MADDVIQQRKTHVQALRKLARACDVTPVRDDAGRQKIESMVEAIRGSNGSQRDKQAAETTWKRYQATWPEARAPAMAAPAAS
eukprot:9897100-Karenia_brevis.AAC.1